MIMYEVEIESEVRPGTYYRVDDPHAKFSDAAMVAAKLALQYHASGHMRVARYGRVALEV